LNRPGGHDHCHAYFEHLRRKGLVALTPQLFDGQRTALVTLTRSGQELVETHRRDVVGEDRQAYYVVPAKPREATHDAQLSRSTPRPRTRCRRVAAGFVGSSWITS
jgi:DNA-binding MarR family transcriptional regulator